MAAKQHIAVIKYNAGNIRSIINALERQGHQVTLTDDQEVIRNADKVIMPGQGEARSAMHYLKAKGLDAAIPKLSQPFLGICLGLQLMGSHSEENDTHCLNLVPERILRFPDGLKIPQIGWNDFTHAEGPLFKGIDISEDMYFVHSYYMEPGPDAVGITIYGLPFASAIQKDNFYGVQFHPEKSGAVGEHLLENFLQL